MADEEEVTYDSATRDVLISASKLIGVACVDPNLAFTKCKAENADPEACLKLGSAVLACNNDVLHKIASKCSGSFEAYRKCLDKNQMNFALCRKEEEVLNKEFYAEP